MPSPPNPSPHDPGSSKATLRLMRTNPLWVQEYEQSRSSVLQATEGWLIDVQHIGSTFLEDGIARPTIDQLAGMSDLRGINPASELIEGINYRRVPSPDWCSSELTALLEKPRHGAPTHTVLLVKHQGTIWNRALRIRNWLDSHLVDWQAFQTVKRDHFSSGCQALAKYTAAKDEFFQILEERLGDSGAD